MNALQDILVNQIKQQPADVATNIRCDIKGVTLSESDPKKRPADVHDLDNKFNFNSDTANIEEESDSFSKPGACQKNSLTYEPLTGLLISDKPPLYEYISFSAYQKSAAVFEMQLNAWKEERAYTFTRNLGDLRTQQQELPANSALFPLQFDTIVTSSTQQPT
eukprot:CAMPEP_0116891282 /NCGR_PEP_ID=MMETSP0467-20121206/1734_1 /TAXON_ID=283647 /ORGANISM="Mesodinium pulex, Strain SPMC105" /LENGTH=162 /DNA_ID=CAMNT_0004559713 /DNA_START=100 /DNA_END=588 /DNA_ORIENTATION=-